MTDDPFVTHRSLLFTVAYEMLGSAADAEDVVQESWLRWAHVDRVEVREPRAYLIRIVTRQALNRLRTLARRREEYIGEWLPEPLLTSPDVAEDIEFAESVSIAMLTVLETLAPAERAVFVLREVFDLPYADIAEAVEKTPAAVRQIAHRAREHVGARRPRIQVDRAEQQQVVDRFLAALQTGDLQVLLDVLAPDVVLVADGGGEVAAFRRPVVGRDRVATLLSRFRTIAPDAVVGTVWLNGAPAGRIDLAGELDTAVSLVVADRRITRKYAICRAHQDEGSPSREEPSVTSATLEMSRAPAATEIPFRSFRRPCGLSVLRATEDLTTPCASALVAPAEQRGAGCGDGHEDNGRHGAHLQPFSEDDQAGEGGYGGVETHQDAEDTSREFAQGFELQRVRDGRGEHRHAEAGEEELRIEQGVACACYPERKEDERPYAERDHKPRPTRESAPRAGGEEDVGGPQASGQEREGHTHRIEVHPPKHAERSEQEDTGRGEHDPQQVEQSPGAGDGHTERTHELERNGNA